MSSSNKFSELKLDLDILTCEHNKDFYIQELFQRLHILMKFFNFRVKNFEEKQTKHGYHVRLQLNKHFNDMEIVILQLLLGSDWKREMHNFLRVRSGLKNWNVLFKEKYNSKGKLISKEQ